MDSHLRELLDLLVRWVHLIAGIMWVGNSMLFNWLDRVLVKEEGDDKNLVGRMWMVHSGGFYDVKKLNLEPGLGASDFAESRQGPASHLVPAWVEEVLGEGGPNSS